MNTLLLLAAILGPPFGGPFGPTQQTDPSGTALGNLDLDGYRLTLDQDADTYILNSRELADDQINIFIAGAADFKLTANTFDANGSLITDASDELHLGTTGNCTVATGAGKVCLGAATEVLTGGFTVTSGNLTMSAGQGLFVRNASSVLVWSRTASENYGQLGLELDGGTLIGINSTTGQGNNNLIITTSANMDDDHGHDALQTNPRLWLHSATDPDAGDNTQYLSFYHDQTDSNVTSGKGDFVLIPDEATGKGVTIPIRESHADLTFAADPGDATKVTSGLVPDGAILLSITTRVTTAATNCTSVSIGDGSDPDHYGATTGITQGTTTTSADHTAVTTNPQLNALEVTITANGGNCFTGVWRVSATYLLPGAPTSN